MQRTFSLLFLFRYTSRKQELETRNKNLVVFFKQSLPSRHIYIYIYIRHQFKYELIRTSQIWHKGLRWCQINRNHYIVIFPLAYVNLTQLAMYIYHHFYDYEFINSMETFILLYPCWRMSKSCRLLEVWTLNMELPKTKRRKLIAKIWD